MGALSDSLDVLDLLTVVADRNGSSPDPVAFTQVRTWADVLLAT